ncbi:NERD domain-containing protein [Filobacillus milosensis]|uniref:NERD domain-containing protein n=1 Tax=Filobacillus milosensis TaxID=94137 RepID=A0A4Y8IXE9_9BACI|nr:NERD domain-containing protein [Filobacillus milosensis]TFB25095.1 NERD domain-containing protein [Filobacillus milosensis]
MAQLIKLQDYISRYENDMFRYPSHFIRMKKDNYQKLIKQWQTEQEIQNLEEPEYEEEKPSFFNKLFSRSNKNVNVWEQELEDNHHDSLPLPDNENELKLLFLEQVFSFQLKWASSTLQEVSYIDKAYETDSNLKYFLQRFPDTYLVLYQPIFKLKKAVIEGEVIIITPTEILLISSLEGQSANTIYKPVDERKWLRVEDGIESHQVNPLISLKRMEKTLNSVLHYHELDFPIKKIVFAPNHRILEKKPPFQTEYIDYDNYNQWFHEQRQSNYPIKFQQLKVAEAILEHTQKTFVKRPIWKEEEDHML